MSEPMVTVFELPLSVYKAARLYKQADAARGRWKRVAIQQRRTIKALENEARGLRLEVADLGREIERLKAERDRAVADLEPMQRTESAALDEIVRLERAIEDTTGRKAKRALAFHTLKREGLEITRMLQDALQLRGETIKQKRVMYEILTRLFRQEDGKTGQAEAAPLPNTDGEASHDPAAPIGP